MKIFVRFVRRYAWDLLVGASVLAVCVFLFRAPLYRFAGARYEDALYALRPSAERAMSYADKHFSATRPLDYDIARAEYFYRLAQEADPQALHVHHQLARIAFLQGNFPVALAQINLQIEMHGDKVPSSYYVKGLILGYMKDYNAAARAYQEYLSKVSVNWAGLTDYAWVLLMADRPAEALAVVDRGLGFFPENPWLLNTRATALFELGRYDEAIVTARAALPLAKLVTREQWLTAYPGNDPNIAAEGIRTLIESVEHNIQHIETRIASSTVQ